MKNKFVNSVRIEGYVYQHSLAVKQVKNQKSENFGKDFINGKVSIATDEECMNVVDVHFSYVTPTTKNGGANRTYNVLNQIMNGATVLNGGKENALKVQIDTSIALNDFYDKDGQLASPKRLEGGFATIINALNPDEAERNKFTTDILITSVVRTEADEEKKIDSDYVTIRGVIFDFRKSILPTDFRIRNEAGMAFFEDLGATKDEPVFTKIWGNVVSQTVTTKIEEPTAFGVPSIRTVTRSNKEYLVTGTAQEPGELSEATITMEELAKAVQDRNTYLATVKKNQEEYEASKNSGNAAAAPVVNNNAFNF